MDMFKHQFFITIHFDYLAGFASNLKDFVCLFCFFQTSSVLELTRAQQISHNSEVEVVSTIRHSVSEHHIRGEEISNLDIIFTSSTPQLTQEHSSGIR